MHGFYLDDGMMNKNLILKKVSKLEDKLLVSKVLDKALKSEKSRSIVYSDFLDPYQKSITEKALSGVEEFDYFFHGGYPGAEREVIFFRPDFIFEEEDQPDLPFKVVQIRLRSRENLTHRDYLGSLIGLGIKREKIGDILVKEDSCSIIVMNEIADFIIYNLSKVGNVRIDTDLGDIGQLEVDEPKVREIKGTVASPRLDSLASLGYGISRSKIADYIRAEKVNLNWEPTCSLTKQVKEGDVISIRGKGRVEVISLGGLTKKGRISTVIKKYI